MGCAIIRDNLRIIHDKICKDFNGTMLKMGRESRGLSLKKLAKHMGWRVDHLREMELGLRKPTEYDEDKLCEYLYFPHPFFYCKTEIKDVPDIVHVCGSGVQPCSNCGEVADYLCDYPVGEGKTCDLNLCRKCRTHVGKFDFCNIHAEKNKVIRMIEN